MFFEKALHEVKAGGITVASISFGSPLLEHTIKTNYMKLQIVDLEMCTNLIFQKWIWN